MLRSTRPARSSEARAERSFASLAEDGKDEGTAWEGQLDSGVEDGANDTLGVDASKAGSVGIGAGDACSEPDACCERIDATSPFRLARPSANWFTCACKWSSAELLWTAASAAR